MHRAIATLLYSGTVPVAPGTIGSLVALLLGYLVFAALGPWGFAAIWLAATLAGTWSIAVESSRTQSHDASEIVIDELSGQWIAMFPALLDGRLWPLLAAFALFRLFDITKPGPIGAADRWHTPTGVMLDDILAGIAAALVLLVITWLS